MRQPLRLAATAAVLASLIAGTTSAQSLYGIDGPAATVIEFTGPPAGPCFYPAGPLISAWPTPLLGICPGTGPFPPPPGAIDGDIAVDRLTDTVYTSDGPTIASYTSTGVLIDSFPAPIFVVGMGFDSIAGVLWITDSVLVMAILPPPAPACLGPPPVVVLAPFPIAGPGLMPGPVTDIDWDTSTGSFWVCDSAGFVGNFLPGGAPGPFGIAPVVPGPCPLGVPLTGIAVDGAAPPGTFFVTDGFIVAYMLPGGAPAPPTFYATAPCSPVPGPPISGLAFAARAIAYGAPFGAGPPSLAATAQSVAPNPGYGLSTTGVPPGSFVLQYVAFGASCPPIPLPFPVYLALVPAPIALPPCVAGAGGGCAIPLPLPPLPPGLAITSQSFILTPLGPIEATAGIWATTSLP